jgi:hypothetical protein
MADGRCGKDRAIAATAANGYIRARVEELEVGVDAGHRDDAFGGHQVARSSGGLSSSPATVSPARMRRREATLSEPSGTGPTSHDLGIGADQIRLARAADADAAGLDRREAEMPIRADDPQ